MIAQQKTGLVKLEDGIFKIDINHKIKLPSLGKSVSIQDFKNKKFPLNASIAADLLEAIGVSFTNKEAMITSQIKIEGVKMSWHEETEVIDLSIGDIVLSYDLNKKIIVESQIVDEVEELISDNAQKFEIILEDRETELTVYHIIPFWRDGELIEDNCGVVQVGDELLCIDPEELTVSKGKVI